MKGHISLIFTMIFEIVYKVSTQEYKKKNSVQLKKHLQKTRFNNEALLIFETRIIIRFF